MSDDLVEKVRAVAARAELVRAVASVRRDGGQAFALGKVPLRSLSTAEVAHLESLGNSCDDWSRVRVADGFDCRRVRHSSFQGDVILGRFTGKAQLAEGLELPCGVYG